MSVLLYGCESWKMKNDLDKKLATFQNRCLRRILNIRWQQHVTNEAVLQQAEQEDIRTTLNQRRLQWVGHVIRMNPNRYAKSVLGWHPAGFRKPGKPKLTYWNTLNSHLNAIDTKWTKVEKMAKSRSTFRQCAAQWSKRIARNWRRRILDFSQPIRESYSHHVTCYRTRFWKLIFFIGHLYFIRHLYWVRLLSCSGSICGRVGSLCVL